MAREVTTATTPTPTGTRIRPTLEEVAKQSLEVLKLQREFFRAKPGSSEKSVALTFSLNAEAKLRKMAEAVLAPPTLFDGQD